MQSDGLWNGQRCSGGQYLRKENQGMNNFKKTCNFLVRLKMPHRSDCVKRTSSVNPVRFSGTFVTVWPFGARILLRTTSTPCIFASYSGASPCKMDCH